MDGISVGGNVESSIFIAGNGNVVNLGGGAAQPEPVGPASLRVLVVIASPIADRQGQSWPEHPPLNVWQEWKRVRAAIPPHVPWEIVRLHPPTHDHLDDALRQAATEGLPFAIVHFIGHGGAQGLIIEDELGREAFLPTEALAETLAGQGVRCLLLNACETLPVARRLVEQGVIEAAVATTEGIPDPVALTFARRFYERLAAGDTLEGAVRRAQRRVEQRHGETWAQRYRLEGEGDLRLLDRAERGTLRARRYPLATWGLRWEMVERFVGRREAMLRLGRWLLEGESLTFAIHGVGGIGKTALALAAAVRYAPAGRFEQLLFLSTEGRSDYGAGDLLIALRRALGIVGTVPADEEAAAYEAARLLNEHLLLLILDNLESLGEAASASLARLLAGVDARNGTRVLMTLRPRDKDPLTARVQPRDRLHLERMSRPAAMRLFLEAMEGLPPEVARRRWVEMEAALGEEAAARAQEARRAARMAFLPAGRAPLLWAVAERAYDYPAFLWLIARQLQDYHWAEVAQRLAELPESSTPAARLEQFIGRMVDALARQHPEAAALLCTLLPFRGGAPAWALPAMMAMEQGQDGSPVVSVEGGPAMDFRDRVIQPALGSGLLHRQEESGTDRYRLEPYVRHYLERRRCGDEAVQRGRALRHAALFLPVAQALEEAWMRGEVSLAEPPEWENLAAALTALMQAPPEEGRDRLLVALIRAMPNLLRLTTAATAAQKLGWLEASLAATRRLGDAQGEANVLKAQGDVLAFQKKNREALERYEAALALCRAVGDRLGEANVLQAQGDVLAFQKKNREALERYEAALALYRAVGARLGEANVLQAQGDVLAFLDRRDEALERYEAALALYRAVGDRLGEANVLKAQGRMALAEAQERGEAEALRQARAAFDAAVALHRAIGDAYSEAGDRFYRADALLLLGEVEAAMEDLRFAEATFRRLGLPYADWAAQKRQAIEAWLREQGKG